MGELINIGSIMGKELLNLADGTMLGKVCGVVLTPDCKVAGLKVRERKLMGSTVTVAFENVKSFGATITLHGVSNVLAAETRTVLGKNVITADREHCTWPTHNRRWKQKTGLSPSAAA